MDWLRKWGTAVMAGAIVGTALWALPSEANDGWQTLEAPQTSGGLVLCPRISGAGTSNPFMAWGGTGSDTKFKQPEFTFAVLRGDTWSDTKSPFFGNMMGNVRCLELSMARYVLGAIFMRNTEQSKTTFEVLFAGSNDKGWSFSTPTVVDSFVHEDAGGTAVTVAGVGGVKPMFMLGWLSEAKQVKAAIWNPAEKADRPRAEILGHYGRGYEHMQMAGVEGGDFIAAWYDGRNLMTAAMCKLVGEVTKTEAVVSAKIGYNFALTDYRGKNPILVYELPKVRKSEGARRQLYAWHKDAWTRIPVAAPPNGERPCPSRLAACQDEDGNVHVATVPKSGDQVLYNRVVDGKFTEPEVALRLKKVLGLTGFDIAVVDNYVYVTASQGPHLYITRRKVKA